MKTTPLKTNKPKITKPKTYVGVKKEKGKSLYRRAQSTLSKKTRRRK